MDRNKLTVNSEAKSNAHSVKIDLGLTAGGADNPGLLHATKSTPLPDQRR